MPVEVIIKNLQCACLVAIHDFAIDYFNVVFCNTLFCACYTVSSCFYFSGSLNVKQSLLLASLLQRLLLAGVVILIIWCVYFWAVVQ